MYWKNFHFSNYTGKILISQIRLEKFSFLKFDWKNSHLSIIEIKHREKSEIYSSLLQKVMRKKVILILNNDLFHFFSEIIRVSSRNYVTHYTRNYALHFLSLAQEHYA